MRSTGCSIARSSLLLSVACAVLAAPTTAAGAQQPPKDPCALLTVALLNKTLNEHFAAPISAEAPPAYAGQAPGTTCRYETTSGHSPTVVLIVYVDHSPTEAKDTFERLSMFYQPSTKADGIGDTAYTDRDGAIHVLKGQVRYYIDLDDAKTPAGKTAIRTLALAVAAQL